MNIEIPLAVAILAIDRLAEAGLVEVSQRLNKRLTLHGKPDVLSVDVSQLGLAGLDVLYALAKEESHRALMMQITSYRNIVASPFDAKVGNLKSLPAGLIAFVIKDHIDGWLYHQEADGVYLPWLVRSIKYAKAEQYSPAQVVITLSANSAKKADSRRESAHDSTKNLFLGMDDIVKQTIPEILAKQGYFHETPELKAAYENDLEAFSKFRPQHGAQFLANGLALEDESYRQTLVALPLNAKMVNDEQSIRRVLQDSVNATFWEDQEGAPVFSEQPYHCRLYMFNLAMHAHQWVHVASLTPYVYRPELRDKLILPELHRDLIEVLATDMDVIMEDLVDGKSGGTTILCKGSPGLGKTLTAEVYAEVVGKPLYRVHSGQLGTDAASVEKSLMQILERASSWGALLLLDEADVFVRKRDDDLNHNAVVAVFLRTLEYFNGLLFMTTNRSEDIDDAILSRCIAIIQYGAPTPDLAPQYWHVLSKQFKIDLPDSLIDKLTTMFPKASGRDVKELLKLTSKYARRKKIHLDAEVFRKCAMFRGLG